MSDLVEKFGIATFAQSLEGFAQMCTSSLSIDDGPMLSAKFLDAADRIRELEAQLKTVLDREAETTARYDAKAEKLQEKLAEAREALKRMDHVANEWADVATNGPIMLKNVHDGLGTVVNYVRQLEDQFERCRALWSDARSAYERIKG